MQPPPAKREVVRKNLEEGSQRELEEVQRLHQEQVNVGVGKARCPVGSYAGAPQQRAGFAVERAMRCLVKVKKYR